MRNILAVIYALLGVGIAASMIIMPQATFDGAKNGLITWATILVPSLLPFFIIAEILINLGVVRFLGVLLEPIMRPVFNLPGSSSFVVAMGFTSGFPMGAVLSVRLREKNLCTKNEASRLVAFTNNSSPLFMLVAIAIGMFDNPSLGIIIALVHYSSNITLGILLGLSQKNKNDIKNNLYPKKNLLKNSFIALVEEQKNNQIHLGKLMGNAIKNGIQTILMIGGFVISFAVLIKLIYTIGIMNYFEQYLASFLKTLNISSDLSKGLLTGLFEITLGVKEVSLSNAPFLQQLIVISLILAWSGLSIQFQILSILSESDLSIRPYLLGRFFQSILAAFYAIFFSFLTTGPLNNLLPSFSLTTIKLFNNPISTLNITIKYLYWNSILILFTIGITTIIGLLVGILNIIRLNLNFRK